MSCHFKTFGSIKLKACSQDHSHRSQHCARPLSKSGLSSKSRDALHATKEGIPGISTRTWLSQVGPTFQIPTDSQSPLRARYGAGM